MLTLNSGNNLKILKHTAKEFHMTAPQYVSKFIPLYVEFTEGILM